IVGRHASAFNVINFSNGTRFTPAQRQGQFSHGFYVRGGFFFIPRCLELNGRISGLFADDIPVFSGNRVVRFDPFNQGWEYTLGMTYYPTGHSYLKIQAEGAYVRHSPISAEKSEFVAGTHESDLIGRVQLQLEF